jgi:hypothetical protein
MSQSVLLKPVRKVHQNYYLATTTAMTVALFEPVPVKRAAAPERVKETV